MAARLAAFVLAFVRVTVAFDTTAPDGSVIVPVTSPAIIDWPREGETKKPAIPKSHLEFVHYLQNGQRMIKRSDVLQLISMIQSRARESRQIDLNTEVIVLGEEK